MQRLVRHWFNGKWGRLARRDVKIFVDVSWWVEARQGGSEGLQSALPSSRRGSSTGAGDPLHGDW
jgi:hypothetical protein